MWRASCATWRVTSRCGGSGRESSPSSSMLRRRQVARDLPQPAVLQSSGARREPLAPGGAGPEASRRYAVLTAEVTSPAPGGKMYAERAGV